MDQVIINWTLGVLGVLLGFLLSAVWQAVKDLQTADKQLVDKVNNIEVLVAGHYVTQDDFQRITDRVEVKLDRIEDMLCNRVMQS